MPRKNSYLTVTDQFCGAGGSSQGARAAGLEVKLAMNHWALAIDTHSYNFPKTDHDCTDISACDPRRYPTTDILITSPECTNHSLAKGVKIVKKQLDLYASGKLDPSAERSRATMWDVPRFAEYHEYNAIVVENVVDARKWVMFDAWLHAMTSLGYMHRCVYLNSMHAHPTPQSRDRMYVVFWKKGNRAPMLDYMPTAWCQKCGTDIAAVQTWKRSDIRFGKYRQQYVYCCPSCARVVEPYYYAAFNLVDWSDLGTRIGDRSIPLSPKTIARIEYGLDKYGKHPFQVVNYTPGYSRQLWDASGAITCQDHHGVCSPLIVATRYSSGIRDRVKASLDSPIGTQPTDVSHGVPTPFIIKLEHSGDKIRPVTDINHCQTTRQSGMIISPNARPMSSEIMTQTTCQGTGMITPPFLTELHGTGKARQATEPLGVVAAGGNHHGLVTSESWNSFIAQYYNGSHCTKHITEETGTVTVGDRSALVNYETPRVEDCFYRMLKPHEIKLAMAFGKDYKVLGNSRQQVKQLGNAVTPPAMEWLIKQVMKSLS